VTRKRLIQCATSRLMGRDQDGALANLKAFRKTLVAPAIAERRGRIVKTTFDDGILVGV
ncbi:MAG: adenylate cyclase, partial [Bradyrhizobium sp.]|nr:adenylate cyclase [Bradyrhizobium sp.]